MSIAARLWPRPTPNAVVRDHGAEVYRRLKRIFGPSADIDDVYQTVFVEVLRSLPSYAGRSRLSAWIRRITYNVAYQEMRLRYRRPEALAIEDASVPVTPGLEAELERRERMRCLYMALEEIDPAQRLAVVLHDIEGLTLKEIALETGRPLPTVGSQLAAGRARLARMLLTDAGREAPSQLRPIKEVDP